MAIVNRQSLTYVLGTSLLSLLLELCQGLTDAVTAHLFYGISVAVRASQSRGCMHNCITTFVNIAVMSSCHNITCESSHALHM